MTVPDLLDDFIPQAVQYRTFPGVTSGQMLRVAGGSAQYRLAPGSYMLQLSRTGANRIRMYAKDADNPNKALSDISSTEAVGGVGVRTPDQHLINRRNRHLVLLRWATFSRHARRDPNLPNRRTRLTMAVV